MVRCEPSELGVVRGARQAEDDDTHGAAAAGSLSSRLAQLAQRRGAFRSATTSDEEEGCPLPCSDATQSLRQLLVSKAADLAQLQEDLQLRRPGGEGLGTRPSTAAPSTRPDSGGRAGSAQHADPPPAVLEPPASAAVDAPPARQAEAPAGGGSVPPTARYIIAMERRIIGEEQGAEQAVKAREISQAGQAAWEAQQQGAEVDAMLAAQLAAADDRERARQEREARLQHMQEEYARQHLAACKSLELHSSEGRCLVWGSFA